MKLNTVIFLLLFCGCSSFHSRVEKQFKKTQSANCDLKSVSNQTEKIFQKEFNNHEEFICLEIELNLVYLIEYRHKTNKVKLVKFIINKTTCELTRFGIQNH